eukprot:4423529-Prorocentrum_lima.AAC.1
MRRTLPRHTFNIIWDNLPRDLPMVICNKCKRGYTFPYDREYDPSQRRARGREKEEVVPATKGQM